MGGPVAGQALGAGVLSAVNCLLFNWTTKQDNKKIKYKTIRNIFERRCASYFFLTHMQHMYVGVFGAKLNQTQTLNLWDGLLGR